MTKTERKWQKRVDGLKPNMTVREISRKFKSRYSTTLFWLRMMGYKYRRDYVKIL